MWRVDSFFEDKTVNNIYMWVNQVVSVDSILLLLFIYFLVTCSNIIGKNLMNTG